MISAEPFDLSDEQLLAECRFEAYRASGPGGQKRNKTSSAVRLTHLPTGVCAIANESRSQHDNRAHALRRLRHRLALEIRHPVDLDDFSLPAWWKTALPAGTLGISVKNATYPRIMSFTLDLLAATRWSVSEAAGFLKTTTGNLVGFLREDEKLWQEVNRRRIQAGLKPLIGH